MVEAELKARLAKLVLVPWDEWDCHALADMRKPTLAHDTHGVARTDDVPDMPVAPGPGAKRPHNTCCDEITMYVERTTAERASWSRAAWEVGEVVQAWRTLASRACLS